MLTYYAHSCGVFISYTGREIREIVVTSLHLKRIRMHERSKIPELGERTHYTHAYTCIPGRPKLRSPRVPRLLHFTIVPDHDYKLALCSFVPPVRS
jgi:hypothetical protein